ncbi:MAG: putative lipid II flippase FtsW [Candidatus Terrybacteria bacterium]|nr:putative lipid II flippase FtsW [Candidatus Terrybacteria bacterium]
MRGGRYDKVFLGTVCLLVLTGIFILASASMGLLTREGADFSKTLFRQIILGVIGGFILLFIAIRIPYKNWRKFALPFFIFSFLLTLLVFIPHIGFDSGGAKRWIKLGPIFFQPSEILKLGFIVYLSAWIVSRRSEIKSFKFGLVPFLVMVAFVSFLLIMEPDVGTLGALAITSMFLFFLGGGKFTQLAFLMLLGLAVLYGLALLEPYRMERIITFLNPSHDPTGAGYQLRQSLISIGSGGIFGRGFGMSVQKFNFLPEPIGDSIFAVFSEEFGFVGCIFLIGLFLFFLYRGFSIALRAPDDFGRLLGAGIVILIITESFINIGAMIGVLPLTGVPLIFVSKGGSALAIALAEIGVLLNISRYGK